uniref:Non-specific serine/threonine protein kinase n=1 Tax=Timspurckia oligopyrenoides TaxID=708627 RepID=A0A7S0ZKN0_9RHOD
MAETGNGNGVNGNSGGDEYVARYRQFVNLSGYMRKQTKVLKRKKKCFIRLSGPTLSCYRERQSSDSSWQVSLRKATITGDESTLEIRIHTASRSIVLFAENTQEHKKWLNAISDSSMNNVEDFYKLGDLIGKGSYGEVREAEDLRTHETRAVKLMDRTNDTKELEFLRREVNVMRTLMHPNIVRTYDIFDTNKTLYVVMEFVQGGDLFEVISNRAADFTEQYAADATREILKGIQYLHQRNIVHRDIKPENILCVNNSFPLHIKLTDFGFANYTGASQMNTFIGTPFYMAPEILTGKGHGPPVDLYATGIVAYAMLSGRLPFESDDEKNAYKLITENKIVFPDADWKSVSDDAKDFVKQCLHWDPGARPTVEAALAHKWLVPRTGNGPVARLDSDLTRLKVLTSSRRGSMR